MAQEPHKNKILFTNINHINHSINSAKVEAFKVAIGTGATDNSRDFQDYLLNLLNIVHGIRNQIRKEILVHGIRNNQIRKEIL